MCAATSTIRFADRAFYDQYEDVDMHDCASRASSLVHCCLVSSFLLFSLMQVSSSQTASPSSNPLESLTDVFHSALSLQPLLNCLDNRTLSIIDRPEFTLMQPYVNRSLVNHWSEQIASTTSMPGSRSNPLFATVAGMGKGKTRFFVELENALNQRSEQDVLAVAIIFNSEWSKIHKFDHDDNDTSMAVEVVLRMLTMAYSVADFDCFRVVFTKALSSLRSRQTIGYKKLLQECVMFLVDDARSSGLPCKKFVLLLDEARRLVEGGIKIDVFDELRGALLDTKMRDKNNVDFQVSMAMTALEIATTGVTTTGRPVISMSLPAELGIDEMYREWLPPHLPQLMNGSLVENNTEAHLKQFLTLTAPLPRATEILVGLLRGLFQPNASLSFTNETTALVLKTLFTRVEQRYTNAIDGPTVLLNNENLVYNILWRKIVDWNRDVSDAMIDAYLINPPDKISIRMQYTPTMAALSLCRLNTFLTPDLTLLKPVVEATVKIATDAAAYHDPHNLGKELAMMGNTILTCKILSAERVNHGNYSLYELLGCQNEASGIANFHLQTLKLTRSLVRLRDFYHPTSLPSSYCDIHGHVAALRQCKLENCDVLVVKGHEREAWDGLWVLRQTDGKPFVLVVDFNFREVAFGDASTAVDSNAQACHFRDTVVAACKEAFRGTSGCDDGSAATAIAAGDFAFVYIDAAPSNDGEDDVSQVFDDTSRYIRLTGAATWGTLTDVGHQVVDIIRLSSTSNERSQ